MFYLFALEEGGDVHHEKRQDKIKQKGRFSIWIWFNFIVPWKIVQSPLSNDDTIVAFSLPPLYSDLKIE